MAQHIETNGDPSAAEVIARTRRWIADIVIGLNLCPFARAVFEGERIRYVVSAAADEQTLLDALAVEVAALAAPEAALETTLLIHPRVLRNFLDYNDFLDRAEQRIAELGMEGIVQVASFHPDYQFAGTAPDDVENYTNRSPYPMLHLLREESISAAAQAGDDLDEIPRQNIETMQRLGRDKVLAMLQNGS